MRATLDALPLPHGASRRTGPRDTTRGRTDVGVASGQSPLLPLARQAGRADYIRRALRRAAEPRFRLPEIPRHAGGRRHDADACLQRRVRRARRGVQYRSQHPRAAARTVHLAVGAQQPARLRERRQSVRPRTLGRGIFQPAEGPRGLRRGEGHRHRVHPVLPDVRGQAVEPEPDERREQHQRRRQHRPARRAHARQARRSAPGRGSAHAQARDRAEPDGQRDVRDHERAVRRRRADGLAAPHRRRDRRDRARAAEEST